MSRLVYTGDLNKNFGEFFPTPYIDLVTLRSPTHSITGESLRGAFIMEIRSSLLFTVPEHDPVMPNNDINFVKDIVNKLQFYYIVTKSTSHGPDLFYTLEKKTKEHLVSPRTDHEETMKKYKKATGVDFRDAEDAVDELSLLLYDSSILVELLKDPPPTSYQNIGAHTIGFDPDAPNKGVSYDIIHISKEDIMRAIDEGQYTTFYSKDGQKILKVQTVQNHQTVVKVPEQVPLTSGERLMYDRYPEDYEHLLKYRYAESHNANVNILAFSSILTPEQLRTSNIKTNAALSMAFGDVAYEHVLIDGAVSDSQIEYSFFDANNEIYGQAPLRGLNGKYYKADTTNHKIIASEFKMLIDRYHKLISPFKRLDVIATSVGGARPLNDSDSADPMLEASLESVSYALTKYAKSPNLVPRLAQARRTILDRSSGTKTGAFYSDSGELLNRANSVIISGTPLTKKLTINAKVMDERKFKRAGYELPNPRPLAAEELLKNFNLGRSIVWTDEPSYRVKLADYLDDTPFVGQTGAEFGPGEVGVGELKDRYARSATGGTQAGNVNYNFEINEEGYLVIYMDTLLGRKTITVDDPAYAGLFQTNYFAKEEYNVSFGYFLYDWQQHIVNNSFLATMINVRSFQKHFGNELLQRYFVPKKAVLKKYMPVTEANPKDAQDAQDGAHSPILTYTRDMTETAGWSPATNYDPNLATSQVERTSGPSPSTLGVTVSQAAYPEKVTTNRNKILQHYLTERNMGFLADTQEASDNNGKLMAFEFQNIDQHSTMHEYNLPTLDKYDYEVHIQDGTKQVMVDLISHYYYLGEALRAYLLDASQECSYNNIDGVFNDFFAESMDAEFAAAPGSAPWLMTAVSYIKNVDFMTNKYAGDPTQMLIAARNLVQKISPRSGTLEALKAFYYNYIDFYETYYSESSTLGKYMSEPRACPDSGYAGPSAFATPFVQTLTLENSWTDSTYSNQSESDRDAFISVINAEQTRYNDAQAAYHEALQSVRGDVAEDIKLLFEERKLVYEEKLEYEAQRVNWQGGCWYVWWWDAWNTKKDFSKYGKTSLQAQNYDVVKDEFSDIDPMGIANDKYGYVWIDPHYEDDVVDWYDVEKYGEPTVYASYRRDLEGDIKCRFIKRAYRYRAKKRKQKAGNEKGERRYGWFSGSPKGAGKLYNGPDFLVDDTKRYLNYYPEGSTPQGGYERQIPGFDVIRDFASYDEYLRKAASSMSGAATEYSSETYTTGQQHESAMDQANTGFNELDDTETSNIGEDHIGRKMD